MLFILSACWGIKIRGLWKFPHGREWLWRKLGVLLMGGPCSVQFTSVIQSCPIFCDCMDYSTLGLPVHHQLPEFTQTHIHWVSDAIQPSHPLSSPTPTTFSLSQHQGLSKWVLHMRWPKYWSFSFNNQSFQWISRIDFLYDGLVRSSCNPRVYQEYFPIPQFKSIDSLLLSFLYSPVLTSIQD